MTRRMLALAALLLAAILLSPVRPASAQTAHPLEGLWEASKSMGPWARGELIIRREPAGWSGEMVGKRGPAALTGGEVVFDLPSRGRFRGKIVGGELRGYWVPAWRPGQTLAQATPVALKPDGRNRWRGEVRPIDERFTLYLGESPLYTFDRLTARPMRIERYGWYVDRASNPYGGGVRILPRDFLKIGQLMLNGGTWEGRRILSRDFVARATTMDYKIGERLYGRLWWGFEWPYKGAKLKAYAALGAGGQNIIVVPEWDFVIGSFSSNYVSRAAGFNTDEQTPNRLLPAVTGR